MSVADFNSQYHCYREFGVVTDRAGTLYETRILDCNGDGIANKTVTYDDPDIGKTMPYGADAMDNLLLEDYEYVAENQDMWIERWNEWLVG